MYVAALKELYSRGGREMGPSLGMGMMARTAPLGREKEARTASSERI